MAMLRPGSRDSIVVGAGPNGLAAAITMARAGKSVLVVEAADRPGGCVRSEEGSLPGFIHDTYASVFSMAVGTPFFDSLPPQAFPVEWVVPPAALAHPFDDGTCLLLSRSVEDSAEAMGPDGAAYLELMKPFAKRWSALAWDILQPLVHVPRHPGLLLSFGLRGIQPVARSARRLFQTDKARSLFAGLGAHAVLPQESLGTTAFALFMGASAHATGWPIPRGGAQRVTDALTAYLQSLYAEIELRREVHDFRGLPYSRLIFLDLTPRQILWITRDRLPRRHRLQLERYGYGPGVCKVDWALEGPIPWKARRCREALTVHLGGTYEEIALSERQIRHGIHPARPFVICVQPSLFDASRAPRDRHTAWAYCHVPSESRQDMSRIIEQQVERFAPGFGRLILSRRVLTAEGLHARNPNLVGGDMTGGANTFFQLLFRPDVSLKPYAFGRSRFRVCSASSPPGGGVHGMCGYNAATRALAEIWKIRGR
jgi:phytoene dehydrogenase-like protein